MQNNLNCGTSYNYRKYKGNFLTPFLERKTVIIVYVHGFLGSKGTFHEFPELLEQAMNLYNVRIINKVFPAFNTNGVFSEFVDYIISWLYTKTEDYPIILMGHSMGGILIADVYRKISKEDVNPEYKSKKAPKIVGVFGFDTPYFGLSSAIANAGVRKMKESISAASDYISSRLINPNINDMNYEGPYSLQKRGESSENRNKELQNSEINNTGIKNDEIIRTSRELANTHTENTGSRGWNILNTLILSTATFAAYSSSLLNQDTRNIIINNGRQLVSESTQHFTNYCRFLEPLIEIKQQYQRVDDLINSSRLSIICGGERFKFKNYYPITKVKDKNGNVKLSTFICLPEDIRYLKFFEPVSGPDNAPDVVFSHTKMFNSIKNPENMRILADKCIIDLYKIIRTLY